MKYLLLMALMAGTAEAGQKDYYVMKFGATWCGPCQAMERDSWSKKSVKDEIKLFKNGKLYSFDSDTAKDRDTFVRYAVSSVPTILIVDKDGRVVKRAVGYLNERQLYDFLHTNVGQKVQRFNSPYAIHNEDVYVFPAAITLKWVIISLAKLLLFFLG